MKHTISSSIQLVEDHPIASDNSDELAQKSSDAQHLPLPLVMKLCQLLTIEKIVYCHWKSNNALDRSASGENDLDLLVSRTDISRFTEILSRLGFKRAIGTAEKNVVGITDYYGYDAVADKMVHVHVHYQLVVGHDMTKNLRLAIEEPYLKSAVQGNMFNVPAPEFEFLVFVIRMALKHLTWDAIFGGTAKLKYSEQKELEYLQTHTNLDRMMDYSKELFPFMKVELLDRCIQALQPGASIRLRLKTGQELQAVLQARLRHGLMIDLIMKIWRRISLAIRWRFFGAPSKRRLEGGGIMIAIIGGDGAGKSTAVNELYHWLSKNFETTKVHMGIPAWSWTTIIIRSTLKIGQIMGLYPVESSMLETLQQKSLLSPGFPWLIREVCRAHDRYWTYVRAQRFSAEGAIVIFDRFPVSQIQLMDGPQTERFVSQLEDGEHKKQFMTPRQSNRLVQALIKLEQSYYNRIVAPEILVVLRVAPEIAVQRKTNENPLEVRARSQEIWSIDWQQSPAYVINSAQSKSDMVSQLKSFVWSKL